MPKDYPLEAVRDVRARATAGAERDLAAAIRAHEEALERVSRAVDELHAFRNEEKVRMLKERERLRKCATSELLRADAYAARQRAHEAALALDLAHARHEAQVTKSAVEWARRSLGERSAEREVVVRHERRWRAERDRARQSREADALDELAAQKHRE